MRAAICRPYNFNFGFVGASVSTARTPPVSLAADSFARRETPPLFCRPRRHFPRYRGKSNSERGGFKPPSPREVGRR